MQPRRALVEPGHKKIWGKKGLAAAAVGLVLVGSATAYGVAQQSHGQDNPSCTKAISIAVDPAWITAAQRAAEAWGETGCATPELVARESVDVATQGLEQDAWIPEDPVWSERLAGGGEAMSSSIVGWSPLVLANRLEALDTLKGPMDARVVQNLSPIRGDWGTFGQPKWGQVKLVVPPAERSVVGAVGFRELLDEVGQGEQPNGNPFGGTAVQQSMAVMQHRIVERPGVAAVTDSLAARASDAAVALAAGPRTGITTEHLVLARPDGIGATPLGQGTSVQMAVLASHGEDAVAAQFAEWMRGTEGAAVLASAGVRTQSATLPTDELQAIRMPDQLQGPVPVKEERFRADQNLARQYSRRYSVLLALDMSGSMAQKMGGDGMTRIEVLNKMVLQLWGVWPPSMSTGLMTFRATDDLRPVIQYPIKLATVSSPEFQKGAGQARAMFAAPPIGGGTPLYDAISQAWQTAHKDYQEGADNRIVVVTDGRDSDAKEKHTLDSLVAELVASADPQRPVRVLYVGLGPEADMKSLQRIASATGQNALQVSTQDELAAVTARFVTN